MSDPAVLLRVVLPIHPHVIQVYLSLHSKSHPQTCQTSQIYTSRTSVNASSGRSDATTSPRGILRLTRDLANNPAWSPSGMDVLFGDEEVGWMGRFKRRFGGEDEDRISFEQMGTGSRSRQARRQYGRPRSLG